MASRIRLSLRAIVTNDGGATWSWGPQASGTNNSLNSVAFIDPGEGWAVGSGGAIINYVTYPRQAFLPVMSNHYSAGW